MLKGLGNLTSMLRQAQQMSGKMKEVSETLKSQRVTGVAGGGLVEVEMNGLGEMIRLKVAPELAEKNDVEMIEDLVPAAVNQANAKAKQLHMEAMSSMTDGMNLPGLNEALSQLAEPQGQEDED